MVPDLAKEGFKLQHMNRKPGDGLQIAQNTN